MPHPLSVIFTENSAGCGLSFTRNFVFHGWRIIAVTMKGETMQIPKQQCTSEFMQLAVTRVHDGLTAGGAAQELGLVEHT